MRRVAAFAAVVGIALPATTAHADCKSASCLERVARKQCSQHRVWPCVTRAIFTYRLNGWQAAWMRRIPGCESRWNPYARNTSGSSGLYQFLPSTWATTRYARRPVFSAKWNALAAAWMVRSGRTGEWSCG